MGLEVLSCCSFSGRGGRGETGWTKACTVHLFRLTLRESFIRCGLHRLLASSVLDIFS